MANRQTLQKNPRERLPLLLSFCLPALAAIISLLIAGLYPAGDGMVLAHDGWHQYYPFFRAFREKLLSGGSLQYTWDVGMGTGYLSLFAYYLSSPLNLLALITPASLLRELFALLTVLKIGFAGLFFGCYLKIVYHKNDLAVPFFALLYALCSWVGGYYWNLMWLDAFALLPLLIAGMVCLLREGKFRLYIISLALSLWCNYYIAYFSCIFVLLCFFGFCITCWNGWRGFLRRFVRIGLCTVLGVGIAAALLLPTLMAMQTTYSAAAKEVNLLALNIASGATGATSPTTSIWQVLRSETLPGLLSALHQVASQFLPPPAITKMSGLPNVYCGFSTVLLAIYYLCCKRIKLREKLFQVLLLLFLTLSFIFRVLDYAWHGFHFPNMLPYRFSFLVSFVLISMAYRAYRNRSDFRPWHLGVILPLALLLIANLLPIEDVSILKYVLSGVILVGTVLFLLLQAGKHHRFAALCLMILLTSEAVLSFGMGVRKVGVTKRSTYPKENANVQALLDYLDENDDSIFYRTEVTNTQTLNDAALNSYHGVSIFTSSANVNFNRFSRAFGLSSWPGSNRYAFYETTPFAHTMLGVKYLLDRDGEHRNTSYNTSVANAGGVNLLQNDAYLGLGFMTDPMLADFQRTKFKTSSIAEQEEMFLRATAVADPLYTHLKHSFFEQDDGCTLDAAGQSGTQFSYSSKEAEDDAKLSILYKIEQSGLFCATAKCSNADTVSIYRNDEFCFSLNIKAQAVFSVGNLEEGDTLKFTFSVKPKKSGTITLDVAMQNDEAFDKGLATLADETWELTEFSDTRVCGTITALQDGLFYSSIPYEPGWTALVDGQPVALAENYDPSSEEILLTDAVISFPLTAGEHTIELTYEAPGLRAGAIISAASLLIFLLLLLLRRKKPVLLPAPARERWQPEAELPAPVDKKAAPSDELFGEDWLRQLYAEGALGKPDDAELLAMVDRLIAQDAPAEPKEEPSKEPPSGNESEPPAEDAP